MARTNKLTSGVFVNVVSTSKRLSSYDEFINTDLKLISNEANEYILMYKSVLKKKEEELMLLADLEEIIMQLRTRDNIKDIKLSVVREYIYARCPFYRRDKDSKDIRVIVGLTEFYGDNMKKLLGNKEFMDKAKEKLISAIEEEIDLCRNKLKDRYYTKSLKNLNEDEIKNLVNEITK